MIKVQKPAGIPPKLSGAGVAATTKDKAAYDRHRQAFITNKKRFTIDPDIYGHPTVKNSLKKAQHHKCCYCEKDQHDEFGAVEHYRPKAGHKSARKTPLNKPGYYWLGYDWANLYFVCGPCNTHKGNLFPLTDEASRATSHHLDVTQEDACILDPGGARDPRQHIVFDSEFIRGLDDYGRATIEACRLGRSDLNELRKRLISDIDFHIGVVVLAAQQQYPAEAARKSRDFLRRCRQPTAVFSACAADHLSRYNIQ